MFTPALDLYACMLRMHWEATRQMTDGDTDARESRAGWPCAKCCTSFLSLLYFRKPQQFGRRGPSPRIVGACVHYHVVKVTPPHL